VVARDDLPSDVARLLDGHPGRREVRGLSAS
jgi:hypothetical protein